MFTDIGKLNALLGTADQYLITDSGFNLLDFATDMSALSGPNISFQTLPYTPENNVPSPRLPPAHRTSTSSTCPYIQQLVASAFNPQPVATGAKTATKSTAATSSATAGPRSVGAQVIGGRTAADPTATPTSSAGTAAAAPAGRSRSRRTRPTASRACTRSELVVTLSV